MELEATEASVRNHVMADVKHNSEAQPSTSSFCIGANLDTWHHSKKIRWALVQSLVAGLIFHKRLSNLT
ncbi:hypothetical protein YC2023_110530 [Brassica napus]